jgi:hypothetical protein
MLQAEIDMERRDIIAALESLFILLASVISEFILISESNVLQYYFIFIVLNFTY